MKFKRTISLLSAAALICSSAAFAAAVRFDPYSVDEIPDRRKPNDIFFQDFTSVDEGTLPSGVTGSSNSVSYVTTDSHNIGGGAEKNCLVIHDGDDAAAYSGTTGSISFGAQTGLVGAEIRYKYIPTDKSNWASCEMQFFDSANKMFSRTIVGSGNGYTTFNAGGPGNYTLEGAAITKDGWYTLSYIIDFDNKRIDAMLKNETTGALTWTMDSEYYSATDSTNISRINISPSYYGGTYVVDYVRITKESSRLEIFAEDNIQKGIPERTVYIAAPVSHAVAKKTNITLDGKFKYTTKNPKVEGENVLVTAKNAASIFNLGYYMTPDGAVIQSGDTKFTVAQDGSGIKNGANSMKLSAECIADDKQVFIPIKDIAEALGYSCSYDAETNTVVITSAAADTADEEKEAE